MATSSTFLPILWISTFIPAAIAALASWISLISFWVIRIESPVELDLASTNTKAPCPSNSTSLWDRPLPRSDSISSSSNNLPVSSTRPTSNRDARASTIPEPQMPIGASSPIVVYLSSPFSSLIVFMAPLIPPIP